MALTAGSRLGPYEIQAAVGTGGMGEVYRARDPRLGRDVAIKVLPSAFAVDPDRLRRFEQEARATAALNHPNILAVYDIGTHVNAPYIVSELLEGTTLREQLHDGAMPVRKAVEYAIQIAQGLAAAHKNGITHRDLKPENIFVISDGRVKILDFGLAKFAHSGAAPAEDSTGSTMTPKTQPGLVLGSAGYMPPEQVRGLRADPRSDIFAFGTVLHEMLSGQRAFRGETAADTIAAILTEHPPDLSAADPDIPPALARIVDRCLEKNPAARFQSAADLAFTLEAFSSLKQRGEASSDDATATTSKTLPSIAVLPFSDMSPQHDQDYFCEGIAEELTNALSKLQGVHVAARTSAFQFKGKAMDAGEIGKRLRVETILEGSVRKAGDRLRVAAQLINVSDGYHLWSERYDRDMDDVFAIQDEIARAIVDKLKVKLSAEPARPLMRRHTDDLEAYNLYLQGRYYWLRRYAGSLQRALECFEQAIARDPSYALAHAGLADAYSVLGIYDLLPPRAASARAKQAAQQAVTLDEVLPEAHYAMAFVHMFFDWDFTTAERDLRRAINLNPHSALAHVLLGLLLSCLGRFEEAFVEATRSRALEPASELVGYYLAGIFLFGRRHDEALAECRRVLVLDPGFVPAFWVLTIAAASLGRHDEAIEAAEREVMLSHRQNFFLGFAAYTYAAAGLRDEGEAMLAELRERSRRQYVSPLPFALVAAEFGEIDQAFEWLERCYEDRTWYLATIGVNPQFDPMRGDARFAVFLEKLGLEGVLPASKQ